MSGAATTQQGWETERQDTDVGKIAWTGADLSLGRAPNVARTVVNMQWSGTVSIGTNSAAIEDALRAVQELASLNAGWDGYGSPAIGHAAIEGALNLLDILHDIPLPRSHISPVPGGGVQIEWESDGKELEIEFRTNGTIAYLATDPQGEKEGILMMDRRQELWPLLVWLSE